MSSKQIPEVEYVIQRRILNYQYSKTCSAIVTLIALHYK